MLQLLIATFVVLLGFPLGYLLAKLTKEELKSGQKYFKILISAFAVCSVAGLIIKNDALFFSSLFFMAITSQSLRKK